MSQSTAEANAITTQPLISPMIIAEPNSAIENMANIPVSPDTVAEVITTQPMMNDLTDEEQEMKNQRRKDQIETIEQVADDCTWCCFTSADCAQDCDCTGCDCTGCDCDNCCDDSNDCCTGCCDGGPSNDVNIDGDDVTGCLECCGACLECCNSD